LDRRNQETIATLLFLTAAEAMMGLAEYMIVSKAEGWTVLHDGTAEHDYATKEAAFEAAVAAASLAIRQGHEVHVSVPGRDAGNKTALGAKEPQRAT
jgi:phosphotransferase system HPr-like phosphotransfer protein